MADQLAEIRRVFVFGGIRGIGDWFSRNVLYSLFVDAEVYLCDIQLPAIIRSGKRFSYVHVEYDEFGIKHFYNDLTDSDIIIVAVPVPAIEELCSKMRSHILGRPVVLNFASVQESTQQTITSKLGDRALCVGLHPLFGPRIGSPSGQTLVVTDYDRSSPVLETFLKTLTDAGFFVEHASSKLHDEMMGYVQVGTHFMYLTFAALFAQTGKKIGEVQKFGTPPYLFFASFMTRILTSDPTTYANIQVQPNGETMRVALINAAKELGTKFRKARRDPTKVGSVLKALASRFEREELAASNIFSDRATFVLRDLIEKEESLRKSGEACALHYSVTTREPSIKIGKILENTRDHIVVENRMQRLSDGKIAAMYNDVCIKNYQHVGISSKRGEHVRLSKRNYRILSEHELAEWELENLKFIQRKGTIKVTGVFVGKLHLIGNLYLKLDKKIKEIAFGKYIFDHKSNYVWCTCAALIHPTVDFEYLMHEIEEFVRQS